MTNLDFTQAWWRSRILLQELAISALAFFLSTLIIHEADFALLEALHREYPETFVVLLTDKSIHEEHVVQALANGARGCLSHEADPFHFLKAVRVVDRGEIWVTRRMLGKIMDKVLH